MDPMVEILSHQPYRCCLDWGREGVRRAASRGDIVVIVDTLRFSTAVIAAVQRGAIVYPCGLSDHPEAVARQVGAEVAAYRQDMLTSHRYSLSPGSYDDVPQGTRIVLPSPNGATCSRYGRGARHLLVGALVNAAASGTAVSALLTTTRSAVTVVACGERWPLSTEDGELRVAIEDYLGAGAILSHVSFDKSPEARVCEAAFVGSQRHVLELMRESTSGRELHVKGLDADVERAAQINLYTAVPILRQERFERFQP